MAESSGSPPRATFALKKEWHDDAPGIELVEIRYVVAPEGAQPDWSGDEDCAVLAPSGPGPLFDRTCAILLPCGLGDAPTFALHYYFHVVQNGRLRTVPAVVEHIVSCEVSYRAARGRSRCVGIQWSVGEAGVVNYTTLVSESELAFVTPTTLTSATRTVLSESWPSPRRSRGLKCRVWGPCGEVVYHVFHLQPVARSEAATAGELWDADGSRLWQTAL